MLRKLFITVLGVLVLVILFDRAAFFWVKHFAPQPPYILHNLAIGAGIDIFWNMTDSGQKPIVFTGSSTMWTGVSPHVFEKRLLEQTDRTILTVNVSQTGGNILTSRDIINGVLIPGGAQMIIYGIEMRALNTNSVEQSYLDSPLGYTLELSPGLLQNASLWLLHYSALARYRRNFYDLLNGQASEFNSRSFQDIDDRGYLPNSNMVWRPSTDITPNTEYTPFFASETHKSELADLVGACHQNNVQCVFVNLPVSHSLTRALPPGDLQAYHTILQAAVIDQHIPFWDFQNDECLQYLSESDFADDHHLNDTGANKFSEILADLYGQQFMALALDNQSPAHCAKIN